MQLLVEIVMNISTVERHREKKEKAPRFKNFLSKWKLIKDIL